MNNRSQMFHFFVEIMGSVDLDSDYQILFSTKFLSSVLILGLCLFISICYYDLLKERIRGF